MKFKSNKQRSAVMAKLRSRLLGGELKQHRTNQEEMKDEYQKQRKFLVKLKKNAEKPAEKSELDARIKKLDIDEKVRQVDAEIRGDSLRGSLKRIKKGI